MIQKPRREDIIELRQTRYRSTVSVMFIIFGLMFVQFLSYIPKQARFKMFIGIQKVVGIIRNDN